MDVMQYLQTLFFYIKLCKLSHYFSFFKGPNHFDDYCANVNTDCATTVNINQSPVQASTAQMSQSAPQNSSDTPTAVADSQSYPIEVEHEEEQQFIFGFFKKVRTN